MFGVYRYIEHKRYDSYVLTLKESDETNLFFKWVVKDGFYLNGFFPTDNELIERINSFKEYYKIENLIIEKYGYNIKIIKENNIVSFYSFGRNEKDNNGDSDDIIIKEQMFEFNCSINGLTNNVYFKNDKGNYIKKSKKFFSDLSVFRENILKNENDSIPIRKAYFGYNGENIKCLCNCEEELIKILEIEKLKSYLDSKEEINSAVFYW